MIESARTDSVGKMKLAVSSLSCPKWDLPQIVEAAARSGFAGIDFRGIGAEIDITALKEFGDDLDRTLALLASRKLAMPCLNTSVTLVSPSPQRWEVMLAEARRYAELAGRTATTFLRIFGGMVSNGMSRSEGLLMAQRHLRQVVKICKPHHCRPLLETHDDWATSQQVLELLHEFDPTEVGVLWDLEHPFRRGELPTDTAKALRRYIAHVHVKDTIDTDGKRRPVLIGQGMLPLADCAAALRLIGFDGWYCLEVEKRWDEQAPDPEQSLPQFSAYMRETWNR